MKAREIVDSLSLSSARRLKSSALRELFPLMPKPHLTEAGGERVIDTGLTGPVNKEILDSTMGQLSDGKWENVPSMSKYWRNANIREQDGKIVIIVKDGWDSGFNGKDEDWIKKWFAGKIKEIVYDEMGGKQWDRKDTTKLDYLGRSDMGVTVSNAYKAYEILKGRNLKNKYEPENKSNPVADDVDVAGFGAIDGF